MNVERINALADLIEKQPHKPSCANDGFNMNTFVHTCGTPSCIAGWAAWEKRGRPNVLSDYECYLDAVDYLGLDPNLEAVDVLFYPVGKDYESILPSTAARTLRHLAKTGEVNWSIPAETGAA